ncbi:MAG: ribonuclease Z [Candidatus Cohnella colombiensis]|uniref:Ribonuclease Z n=1 Tax=Candidatus Cohnella colombiensis TaxID=3121368 RepID=A0AA95EZP1_9BACL|nr:MAG: ribonuclease Z [Cohnella sp.]
MQFIFLGTGAGRPSSTRNVTSIALIVSDQKKQFWLFDVGEATQHRLLEQKLKLNKLERIFITHLHGDHLYGLPGLLSSRSFFEGAGPLQLIGPPGLRDYLTCIFEKSGVHLSYALDIVEINAEGLLFSNDAYTVEVAELEHRVQSFGYRVIERPKPGALNVALLSQYGVEPGPLFGKLKRGADLTLPSGQVIPSSELVLSSTPGRIATILGDTRPCNQSIQLAHHSDLLIHEATFATGMEMKAETYGHSTIAQAAQIAASAEVKQLVLTHFSARLSDQQLDDFITEAASIFPNIVAAYDRLMIRVPNNSNYN